MKNPVAYFTRYYTRYLPSRSRLYEKIDERIQDEELRVSIKTSLESLLAEDQILEDKVRNLLLRGKTPYFIRQNLLAKGFLTTDIQYAIDQSVLAGDFQILARTLEPKVQRWIRQGKSRLEVHQKLFEHQDFPQEISVFLEEQYPRELEQNVLGENVAYLGDRGFTREKIIQKLVHRGFRYEDIQKY